MTPRLCFGKHCTVYSHLGGGPPAPCSMQRQSEVTEPRPQLLLVEASCWWARRGEGADRLGREQPSVIPVPLEGRWRQLWLPMHSFAPCWMAPCSQPPALGVNRQAYAPQKMWPWGKLWLEPVFQLSGPIQKLWYVGPLAVVSWSSVVAVCRCGCFIMSVQNTCLQTEGWRNCTGVGKTESGRYRQEVFSCL